jgi:hypothetical protein
MKRRVLLAAALLALMWAPQARADTRIIVRTTGGLSTLQLFCGLPVSACTVVGTLDGTLGQVFLVTTPLNATSFINLLGGLTGFVSAEVDQVLNLVGATNLVPSPISATLMSDRTLVTYPANTGSMVWNSYANQPAASIVEVQNAQNTFNVTGAGIVADIDTGVDPNHPALQGVQLAGYDFTRNQVGASELNDLSPTDFPVYPPPPCSSSTCPAPAKVNQSSVAILDQSSVAILDGSKYGAFGHGTMVLGVIHLVAPTAQLLPLKAFHSDGTANLSDILRAIYYAVQNSANVINMSFDATTASTELKNALDYANQLGVISVASSGNDGNAAPPNFVYPAALQSDVMGVTSVGSTPTTEGTRSSFSNYGNPIVWVAAPGEAIITTYPFDTYAAGWGTSFSAPFVSGGAALLRSLQTAINEAGAAAAIAHAAPLSDAGMNNGRLDLVPALQSLSVGSGSPDFAISAAPSAATITAGQQTNFTVAAEPMHGSTQTVRWGCTGAPTAATCTVSPSSVTLDGTHTATMTVALTTTAHAISPPFVLPRAAPPPHLWLMQAACLAWVAVMLVLCFLGRASRQRRGLVAAAGLIAVSLWAYSCGGGYGGPPPGSPTLSSIAVSPTSVNGGTSSTGTVTLSGPAPSGGAVVYLSSSGPAATVPASVTVTAGASSATFAVSTSAVATSTQVTISGLYGGTTKTAPLTVTPATSGGTPPGTYTLTVTGTSGNLSHSTSVQVTVK